MPNVSCANPGCGYEEAFASMLPEMTTPCPWCGQPTLVLWSESRVEPQGRTRWRETPEGFHLEPGEVILTEMMGGAVADIVRTWRGVTVEFLGVCFRPTTIHRLFGYPHAGGAKDGNGHTWWVYHRCPNKVGSEADQKRLCNYELAAWKMPGRLKAYEARVVPDAQWR